MTNINWLMLFIYFNIIHFHLGLTNALFSSGYHNFNYHFSHACYISILLHIPSFIHPNNVW